MHIDYVFGYSVLSKVWMEVFKASCAIINSEHPAMKHGVRDMKHTRNLDLLIGYLHQQSVSRHRPLP